MKDTCRLIIIDEYSMLSPDNLFYIDSRLKQIMANDDPFGGVVVVLTGDPAQVPPVKAKCLWDTRARNGMPEGFGHKLYQMFTTVTCLTVNKRLDRSDPSITHFEDFLLRLRDGKVTREDWKYVTDNCSEHSMTREEWTTHIGESATHIFFTNKEVLEKNMKCLQEIGKPIVKIEAKHTGRGHAASSSVAGGLDKLLCLCVGAKVLLTKNIWQHGGLCNGSVGTVVDIIYGNEEPIQGPPGLPSCVLVDFGEDYTGPALHPPYARSIVPIFPTQST